MIEKTKNYFHSALGKNLSDKSECFELELDGTSCFSVITTLTCGEGVSNNRVMLRFEFSEPHDLLALGLTASGCRLLETRPGRMDNYFDITCPSGFTGKVHIFVSTLDSGLPVVLNSFVALRSQPPASLVARYSETRNVDRYENITWRSIVAFLSAPEVSSGCHTIAVNDLLLDFFAYRRGDAPMLCFLHGRYPRKEDSLLPVFSGWGVTEGLQASILIFSDPTLLRDRDLDLGWHAGTIETPVQYLYQLIVEKLISAFTPVRVLFWGGSGGGFSSLYLSAKIPGSTAFVWNPQTNIFSYEPASVSSFGKHCFGYTDHDDLKRVMQDTVVSDLADLYFNADNGLLYLQSVSDWHTEDHLYPFLRKMQIEPKLESKYSGWLTERFYLHLADFSEGHLPPSEQLIKRILRHFVEYGLEGIEELFYT